ncbi:MAG: YggT family protein [Ruminococcaceae bacterium]|nr:YggT family protein [Oscillospiraceae bacterium]
MDLVFTILTITAQMLLSVLVACFFLHAILSWFVDEENTFYRFVTLVIEPVVYPVRLLLYKMNWLQGTPIDFSYLIAFLLVSIVRIFFL